MSYKIIWEPASKQQIKAITDRALRRAIAKGSQRLAAAPTRLSRPTGYPYYGTEQRYRFDVLGRRVALLFLYSQDEQSLHITEVSVQ